MELPKPPWYRRVRLSVLAVVVMMTIPAAAAVLGWQLSQPPASPATTAPAPSASTAVDRAGADPPPTSSPSLTPARLAGVLWQQTGSDVVTGSSFSAPRRWRIVWSFDCSNFAAYGGGNFKLSGEGAFGRLLVQRVAVRARGTVHVTGGGTGNLVVESVCRRWTVKAIAP